MGVEKKRKQKKTIQAQRTPKVAIYIRVSTLYQIDKDSLPMQRKDLIAYSELILGIPDYEIFEDAGYSGKNTARPAFQDMMTRIRNNEFSHVLVWKIDRISRNLLDFTEMYEELRELRVTFVSKNEQFDTSNAMGEAMLKIILVFAELERNMTSERVTATMISRANNGLWNGGIVPFGYIWHKDQKEFSINETEAEICQIMKDKYLEVRSLALTSRFLNTNGYRTRQNANWTASTVYQLLTNPFYVGTYRYNRFKRQDHNLIKPENEWIVVPNHHEALFTQDEYDAIQESLEENARRQMEVGQKYETGTVHIFSGILFCGKCNSRMYAAKEKPRKDKTRQSRYECRQHKYGNCDNRSISDVQAGEFVINYILNMIRAKTSFSKINTPEDLEKRLLYGRTFSEIEHIDSDGLNDYFQILSRYRSDDSYSFAVKKSRAEKRDETNALDILKTDLDKQNRALRRLQDLYLYSDNSISEKDFTIRKMEITDRIRDIQRQISVLGESSSGTVSDEDFVRQASHLLIQKELKDRDYIYFRKLSENVSAEILKTYMDSVLKSVYVADGRIIRMVFKNGLTHEFRYKE